MATLAPAPPEKHDEDSSLVRVRAPATPVQYRPRATNTWRFVRA